MFKCMMFCLAMSPLIAVPLAAEEISIFTVGNSFADSVFSLLPKIAESAGDKVILNRANLGGCSLERHAMLAKASEKNNVVKGYDNSSMSLSDKLKMRKWDYVTIQQASNFSFDASTYRPYAQYLLEHIKKYSPDSEVVMQQTWAYRFDDNRLGNFELNQEQMFEKLTEAYKEIASEIGVRLIPTGYAVQLARESQAVKYVPYDPATLKNLKYPDPLPSEAGSLVVGLSWRKSGEHWTISRDAAHLNLRGRYLQCCVWYGFFFNKPTSLITFVPEGIDPDDAAFLRDVAQKALDEYKKQ